MMALLWQSSGNKPLVRYHEMPVASTVLKINGDCEGSDLRSTVLHVSPFNEKHTRQTFRPFATAYCRDGSPSLVPHTRPAVSSPRSHSRYRRRMNINAHWRHTKTHLWDMLRLVGEVNHAAQNHH
jgi:hypothetical protein